MTIRTMIALAFAAMLGLSACSGSSNGSSSSDDPETSDNGTGDNGGNDNGNGDNGDSSAGGFEFGSGEGEAFEAGVLALGMDTIAADGSTSVTGRLVREDGEPVEEDHEVEFSSACSEADNAEIDTPVTAIEGEFSTTYTDAGCDASDEITAEVEVDGNVLTATATVAIEAANLGSIAFVEAEPDNIGLRGMGGVGRQETSVVTFQVRDEFDNGVANQTVEFSLSTQVGDIQLIGDELVTSGSDGMASVTVKSGTVATPVRVNARIVDTQVGTQSDRITISTGIPEAVGVSLSAEAWNIEALGEDGVTTELTMRLRDRFSNPVVDGTQVQFSTEGGMIEAECLTEDSACSVIWTGQNPRPNDGRSSVLAFMIGEESFIDVDGDGVFGQAEVDAGTLQDTGEPFRDDTESGQFDPGQDGFFFDYDESGERTGPNDRFDGVLCGINEDEAFRDEYCGEPQAPLGAQGVIIMSGSRAYIELTDGAGDIVLPGGSFDIETGALTARVFDINDNPMADGTEITMETDQGEIAFGNTLPIGGGVAAGGNSQTFFFTPERPDEDACGNLLISVESSRGVVTTFEPIEVCEDGTP